jgi:hypothetical protein
MMMMPMTVFKDGPTSATIAMANMMVGNERMVSNPIISRRSSQRGP